MRHKSRRIIAGFCSLVILISLVVPAGQARTRQQDPLSDPANTQQLVGGFVSVLAMAAEPEGPIALAAAQGLQQMMGMLGFFDKPDAVQALSQRIDELNGRVNRLENKVDALNDAILRDKNLQRLKDLRDVSDKLAHVLLFLKNKGPLSQADDNALTAQQQCDKLKDFPDYWEWSDEAIKDIDPQTAPKTNNEIVDRRNADLISQYLQRWHQGKPIKKRDMMDADFKPLPTLQIYTAALIAWMAALDYASNGDTASVKNNYGAKLQQHIDNLSVRANWNKFNGQQPQTLPEKLISHIRSYYVTLHPVPDSNRECDVAEYIDDGFAREVRHVGKNITYTAQTSNDMCGPGKLVNYESGDEQALETSYGLGVMETLVKKLTHLRDQGTIREQYIGTFTPTSVMSEYIYTVRRDGSLWWQEDTIGFAPGKVQHVLSDAKHIGDGWDSAQDIIPGGSGTIYALRKNGDLVWYHHNGYRDGSVSWVGPKRVGTGWNVCKQIIPMGYGVLYCVRPDGALQWNKHNNYRTGDGFYAGWAPAKIVATGWDKYKFVFGGGDGVLYAVTNDGKILWFRHNAFTDAVAMPPPGNSMVNAAQRMAWAKTWEGPKEVGHGWGGVIKAFAAGNGHIYGLDSAGDLYGYIHSGFDNGNPRWDNWFKIPGNWSNYLFVFSKMASEEDAPVIH